MTFEDIKEKYSDREPAFPAHLPKPNESDLNDLIKKYNCKFPKSFIDYQLKYCLDVPIGDFSFDGFGWANKELGPNMNLEETLKGYSELEFPNYLTPFRYDNGDYWCFDNRSSESEFPVVIFDHNSNDIESSPNYNWKNFIDWIDKTMENEY
ncbi:SMI1-KNR4 cell-wall [Tenacibaculum sp. MAR_2009_124]|uniref:SMI1/KNR4 family protein n=1 Tax=Tenacibaculum sp. MAR_2009_124 TaxID=1250059 RepID=UPI0008951D17|nr:SMI1/KNR4 family protein [Tenacibaculum sp. MAR_2009_124]SED22359.1 SMI1-KNR4 cell-wall [Tenacibaculum sp. MAR_2009_124]